MTASFSPPLSTPMIGPNGYLSQQWLVWFNQLYSRVGGSSADSNSDLSSQINAIQSSISAVQNQISALNNLANLALTTATSAQAGVSSLNIALNSLQNTVNTLQSQVAALQAQVDWNQTLNLAGPWTLV